MSSKLVNYKRSYTRCSKPTLFLRQHRFSGIVLLDLIKRSLHNVKSDFVIMDDVVNCEYNVHVHILIYMIYIYIYIYIWLNNKIKWIYIL